MYYTATYSSEQTAQQVRKVWNVCVEVAKALAPVLVLGVILFAPWPVAVVVAVAYAAVCPPKA